MQTNIIHTGDSLTILKTFPDESVDCIVTSPPYWGLRDYNVRGQYGLEKSPKAFVRKMVLLFRECRRVLRDDGTVWINIGDSYSNNGAAFGSKKSTLNGRRQGDVEFGAAKRFQKKHPSLKQKDLVGIPWLLAFALRADGWYLRQDIIWSKPNPMPESVNDRCTKSHEYIFLLSKSQKYYYDAFSIATPYKDKTFTTFGIETKGSGDGTGLVQSENWARDVKVRKPKEWKMPDGWDTGTGSHGSFHRDGREKGKTHKNLEEKGQPPHSMHLARVNGHTMAKSARDEAALNYGINGKGFIGHSGNYDANGNPIGNGKANKRSVWTVSTAPFKEAHFATFPEELIIDCIKAGCPEGGIVLDPFMGAGTTALVAAKNNRKYIGIELNPDYVAIAEKRLRNELGMFYQQSA